MCGHLQRNRVRRSGWSLLGVFLLCCGAQAADAPHVSNVRFDIQKDEIRITYDIGADTTLGGGRSVPEAVARESGGYRITLQLRREGDKSFSYVPVNVLGDVGEGIKPGPKRTIWWDYHKELPGGLAGDDFYFVVLAEPRVQKSNALLWIGGSAAVLAGGALAVILSTRKGGTPAAGGFPAPPTRPQ